MWDDVIFLAVGIISLQQYHGFALNSSSNMCKVGCEFNYVMHVQRKKRKQSEFSFSKD